MASNGSDKRTSAQESPPLAVQTRRQTIKQIGEMIALTAIGVGIAGAFTGIYWWGYVLAGGFGLMVASS